MRLWVLFALLISTTLSVNSCVKYLMQLQQMSKLFPEKCNLSLIESNNKWRHTWFCQAKGLTTLDSRKLVKEIKKGILIVRWRLASILMEQIIMDIWDFVSLTNVELLISIASQVLLIIFRISNQLHLRGISFRCPSKICRPSPRSNLLALSTRHVHPIHNLFWDQHDGPHYDLDRNVPEIWRWVVHHQIDLYRLGKSKLIIRWRNHSWIFNPYWKIVSEIQVEIAMEIIRNTENLLFQLV